MAALARMLSNGATTVTALIRTLVRTLAHTLPHTPPHTLAHTLALTLLHTLALAVLAIASVALALASPAMSQKQGGTLRIYNSSNPPSASPHEDTTIAVVMPFMAVYNNLVRFDPAKPHNSFDTIIPELATTWEWDATKTRLTFKLRADVKWHDGN